MDEYFPPKANVQLSCELMEKRLAVSFHQNLGRGFLKHLCSSPEALNLQF